MKILYKFLAEFVALRKVVFSIIAIPLLIVPLFCSCVQKVEAATVGVEHCNDDDGDAHSVNHNDSKADHQDQNCDCGHASNAVLENATISQLSFSSVHNSFFETAFIEPKSAPKHFIYFAYLGPPLGKSSKVPLYIQQHSLRI